MQILDQERDEIISKLESEIKTLETKNLELKYTNRNLISTVSEQKNTLKSLQAQINELKSSKVVAGENNLDKLKKEHELLLEENKKLKIQFRRSQNEINELKKLVPDSKSNKGLFGRFLNRSIDESPNDNVKKPDKKN